MLSAVYVLRFLKENQPRNCVIFIASISKQTFGHNI